MLLTILSYLMIIIFMFVIMKKKLSPLTALILVPLVFVIIVLIINGTPLVNIGEYIMEGIVGKKGTAKIGIMLLFAILYFSIMLDAGLFDPVTNKMIRYAKGDPMKVLIATAVVSAVVSVNGDGTTTTLICCSAFLPIYKKLNMRIMNLGVLIILQNTIMNLLPWGGPTARAMSVLGVEADILSYLAPGMIISVLYVIFFVAIRMGKKERARLGVIQLTEEELTELTVITDESVLALRRPQNILFNAFLTLLLVGWLIVGSFVEAIEMPPLVLFMLGTCIALLVNYPNLKDQSKRIGENAGDAVQVVILVFAAGAFMGLFQESGLAEALANSFTTIIHNNSQASGD